MNKSLHSRTKVRSRKDRKAEAQRCETLFISFLMIVIYRMMTNTPPPGQARVYYFQGTRELARPRRARASKHLGSKRKAMSGALGSQEQT